MIPNNQITLLQNGEACFSALEAAFDRAKHEIYLESYIFENDNTGLRIADALRRAAFRGVKTHLLIDGFGSKRLPKTMGDYMESNCRYGDFQKLYPLVFNKMPRFPGIKVRPAQNRFGIVSLMKI